MNYYVGNLDGMREGLVLTNSWQGVSAVTHSSVYSLKQYWHKIPKSMVGKALPDGFYEYDVLYTRPNDCKFGKWIKGKCELKKHDNSNNAP